MLRVLAHLSALPRWQKVVLQVVLDLCMIMVAYLVAMALRLDNWNFSRSLRYYMPMVVVLPLTIAAFAQIGLYRAIVRHITSRTLGSLVFGVVFSALVMAAASHMFRAGIPRSVPFIYIVVLFMMMSAARLLARNIFRHDAQHLRKPVIVYGAGDAGRQLVNAMAQSKLYNPKAFVDDNPALHRATIGGVKVYDSKAIARLIDQTGAKTILLALPSVSSLRRREIVQNLSALQVDIKTIPGIEDIISGKAGLADLRNVTPEDLLGRDPVPPRDSLLRQNITGKVVMVSGAGGSIGSEICRQVLALAPKALVLYEMSEFALYAIEGELADITAQHGLQVPVYPVMGSVLNGARLSAVLARFGVQTIYHAAAYKHVPLVEENMAEGITNNVFGTHTLANAAVAAEVERFILISTDKAVRPTNVMGASKRLAELVCQAFAAQSSGPTVFSMVRFGNVLASSGSVIPRFRAQIAAGGPVTVTHRDINRFFMTIPEAAQLVIQAGAMAKGGDVFVLDMGEPVRILDLAISMVRLSGHNPYVIDSEKDIDPARGDMPILITGLRKGEKLYEELLIGNNSAGTDHPRIMTASEIALDMAGVTRILQQLQAACAAHDAAALRLILQAAPLDYQPSDLGASDLLIAPLEPKGAPAPRGRAKPRADLRLVAASTKKPAG